MNNLERAAAGQRHLVRLVAAIVVLVLLAALAGCGAPGQLQPVHVPVPVECRAQEPGRPAMPTESLRQGDTVDAKVKAALAEIELREDYELQLVAALRGCTRAIAPAPAPS